MIAVYAAQKVEDKHDPTHYIDLYESQEVVNVSHGCHSGAQSLIRT